MASSALNGTTMRPLRVFVSDCESWLGSRVARAMEQAGCSVIGSSRSSSSSSPSSFLEVGSIEATRAAIECNVIILSLLSASKEAASIGEALRGRAGTDGVDHTVIALSTILTWDRTPQAVLAPPPPAAATTSTTSAGASSSSSAAAAVAIGGIREDDWKNRRPAPAATNVFTIENLLIGIARQGCRVHVVAAGLPFGEEGGPLAGLCRAAWECGGSHTLAAVGKGIGIPTIRTSDASNVVPTIHVADLVSYATRIALASARGDLTGGPSTGYSQPLRYSFAVSAAGTEGNRRDTAGTVVRFIASALGDGRTYLGGTVPVIAAASSSTAGQPSSSSSTTIIDSSSSFGEDPSLSNLVPAYFAAHITVEDPLRSCAIHSHPVVGLVETNQCKAKEGCAASSKRVIAPEFIKSHDLQPVRVWVHGPPGSGKSHLASILSAKYRVPVVTVKSAIAAIRATDVSGLADGTEKLPAVNALKEAVQLYYLNAKNAAAAAAAAARAAAEEAAAAAAAAAAGGKGGKPAAPAKAAPAAAAAAGGKGAAPSTAAAAATSGVDAVALAAAALILEKSAASRAPRLPALLLARVMRTVLSSPKCRNMGYVLDGYPRTYREAELLFSALPFGDDGTTPQAGDEVIAEGRLPSIGDEKDDDEDTLHVATTAGATSLHMWVPLAESRTPITTITTTSGIKLNPALRPHAILNLEADVKTLRKRSGFVPVPPVVPPPADPAHAAAVHIPTAEDRFTRRLRRSKLHSNTTSSGFERSIPVFISRQMDGIPSVLVNVDSLEPKIPKSVKNALLLTGIHTSSENGEDDAATSNENAESKHNETKEGEEQVEEEEVDTVPRSTELEDRALVAAAICKDILRTNPTAMGVVVPEDLPTQVAPADTGMSSAAIDASSKAAGVGSGSSHSNNSGVVSPSTADKKNSSSGGTSGKEGAIPVLAEPLAGEVKPDGAAAADANAPYVKNPQSIAAVDLAILALVCPTIEKQLLLSAAGGGGSGSSSSAVNGQKRPGRFNSEKLAIAAVAAKLAAREAAKQAAAETLRAENAIGVTAIGLVDASQISSVGMNGGNTEASVAGMPNTDGGSVTGASHADDAENNNKSDSLLSSIAAARGMHPLAVQGTMPHASIHTHDMKGDPLKEVLIREAKLLEKRTQPTRSYLAKGLMRPLTGGMITAMRAAGEDDVTASGVNPLDRLADALFTPSTE